VGDDAVVHNTVAHLAPADAVALLEQLLVRPPLLSPCRRRPASEGEQWRMRKQRNRARSPEHCVRSHTSEGEFQRRWLSVELRPALYRPYTGSIQAHIAHPKPALAEPRPVPQKSFPPALIIVRDGCAVVRLNVRGGLGRGTNSFVCRLGRGEECSCRGGSRRCSRATPPT
jgi:hypothetical protein